MPRMIDNSMLFIRHLKVKFKDTLFTEEQFAGELQDFLYFGDLQTAKKYLAFCLRFKLITPKDKGYIATPRTLPNPRQVLEREEQDA